MSIDFQWVPTNVLYRYPRDSDAGALTVDGHRNFRNALRPRHPDQPVLQLERGINVSKEIGAVDEPRRPVVLLRSSPWKAGTGTTPWHDEYDLPGGVITYFGDSKPDAWASERGATGNRTMESLAPLFYSSSRNERQFAPPIALFRGESTRVAGRGLVHKGFVRFVGIAVLESHETVRQFDADGVPFENIAFNLRLCPLDDTAGRVDWSWINDRRDETIPAPIANLRAPYSWRYWIETGELPRGN